MSDPERFYVSYTRDTPTGPETWEEDYPTLELARENAEYVYRDSNADSAVITARISQIREEYHGGAWTIVEGSALWRAYLRRKIHD